MSAYYGNQTIFPNRQILVKKNFTMKGGKDTVKTRPHVNCLSTLEILNLVSVSFMAGVPVDNRSEYFL